MISAHFGYLAITASCLPISRPRSHVPTSLAIVLIWQEILSSNCIDLAQDTASHDTLVKLSEAPIVTLFSTRSTSTANITARNILIETLE